MSFKKSICNVTLFMIKAFKQVLWVLLLPTHTIMYGKKSGAQIM